MRMKHSPDLDKCRLDSGCCRKSFWFNGLHPESTSGKEMAQRLLYKKRSNNSWPVRPLTKLQVKCLPCPWSFCSSSVLDASEPHFSQLFLLAFYHLSNRSTLDFPRFSGFRVFRFSICVQRLFGIVSFYGIGRVKCRFLHF